jgi:hypothetical protein
LSPKNKIIIIISNQQLKHGLRGEDQWAVEDGNQEIRTGAQ